MCLTLPEVLITVMGIEKLVPTWRDLEVFLQLLPRSSTAERMNPYTSMWTGVTPGDGPQRVPPDPARQRPDRRPVGHDRPPGAALHPLLGLPERLPRLRADRRAGVRFGLSGADRGDPDAPAARDREASGRRADRLAARSPRRCAAPASTSARSGSTSPRFWSTSAGQVVRQSEATPPPAVRRRRSACGPRHGRCGRRAGSVSPSGPPGLAGAGLRSPGGRLGRIPRARADRWLVPGP